MVNFKTTGIGTIMFFIMYGFVALTSMIIPSILDNLDMVSELKYICWAMLVIVWVLALVIVPAGVIIYGIYDRTQPLKQILGVTMGVLYFIFSLALCYFTWSWTSPMTSVFSDSLSLTARSVTLGSFWVGYIVVWVLNVLIVPFMCISEAKE